MKSQKGLKAKRHAEHALDINLEAQRIMYRIREIKAGNPLGDDELAELTDLWQELESLEGKAQTVPV